MKRSQSFSQSSSQSPSQSSSQSFSQSSLQSSLQNFSKKGKLCVDKKRVQHLFQSVIALINFFNFDIEDQSMHSYWLRCMDIMQASLNATTEDQNKIIRLLGLVKTKFEDDDAVLPEPTELSTLQEKLEFYRIAIHYVCFHCFSEDEAYDDYDFDFPRLLSTLTDLAKEDDYATKLDEFVAKALTYEFGSAYPNITSHFWKHMDPAFY